MQNRTLGKVGAAVAGVAVLAFAVSMVIGLFVDMIFASCFASMFIAIGYVLLAVGLYAGNESMEHRAAGLASVAFAVVYAVIILLVYYAECTTVRMSPGLSEEALSLISYGHLGSLFFNYDLLGYAFLGLSTFFVGFVVRPVTRGDKWLQRLLWVHGIFFVTCLILPMFPVFAPGTDAWIGTLVLEVWCVYFLPVCVLAYRYFKK